MTVFLIVLAAVIVAAVLLGGFWYGSRRARSRRVPDPPTRAAPSQRNLDAERGRTWQTIDDDPDQGAPRRAPDNRS